MDRRIAPPNNPELKTALERLTERHESLDGPLFHSKQKAMMFAASLGYFRKGSGAGRLRDTGSAIRFEIFQSEVDDSYVLALAIAKTDDLKVLDDTREEEVVNCFEEYAYAGLLEINQKCFESGRDPLEALVDLAQDACMPVHEEIAGIDPDVLRNLIGE